MANTRTRLLSGFLAVSLIATVASWALLPGRASASPVVVSQLATAPSGKHYLQVDGYPYLYMSVENWGLQQTLGGCNQCTDWRYNTPQFATPLPRASLENVFEKTKAAGYNTISMILDWNQVEPTTHGTFDWSLVDQYLSWANKYDLRIDWVWFGALNECGSRLPGHTNGWMTWVPTYVQSDSTYFGDSTTQQDVSCAWLPDGGAHTADATYLFASERNAVAQLFAHLATVDTTHRTILFQDENEPNLHPGWANSTDRSVIVDLLSQLAHTVKQSDYSVAVRINAAGPADDTFNHVPYVDFQGSDPYTTSVSQITSLIVTDPPAGPLPSIAENDGSYTNISTLAAAALVNGGLYNSFQLDDHFPPQGIYDGAASYYPNWTLGTIPPLRPGAARMKHLLTAINKIRTVAAAAAPAQWAGYNIATDNPSQSLSVTSQAGDYRIGFTTADGAVAVALNSANHEYLATDSAGPEVFRSYQQPLDVSSGHLDDQGNWVTDAARTATANGDGSYSVTTQPDDLVRLTLPATTTFSAVVSYPLSEGSGSVTADASGNGHSAALSGGAAWVTGISGAGLQFDGSSGYLSTGWSPPTANAARTMSTWFKTTSTSNADWVSWGSNTSNGLSQLGVYQGGLGYLGYANDLTVPVSSYANGQWHQLTATFDGATLILYLDGTQVASKATTLATGSSSLNIGRSITADPGQYYSGSLDDINIYPVALTSTQVTDSYHTP